MAGNNQNMEIIFMNTSLSFFLEIQMKIRIRKSSFSNLIHKILYGSTIMSDRHNPEIKLKTSNIFKHIRKPLNIITEIILLIAFTVMIYVALLYFSKYLWIIFTATPVGQSYSSIFQENYRITNDVLNRGIIRLGLDLTLTACAICLIIGAVFKFLHITRYLYSGRGYVGRIIFFGLPLVYVVAVYAHYMGNFSHMDTALTVALVPTLCVFARCFKYADDVIPELADLMHGFRKPAGATNNHKEEKGIGTDLPKRKEDTKQSTASYLDQPIRLQDVWNDYRVYITAIPIILIVTVVLFAISQKSFLTKTEDLAAVKAPEMKQAVAPPASVSGQPANITGTAEEWHGKALVLNNSADRNDILKAIECLDESIRLKPDYVNAYIKRGTFYAELDQYELAIGDYDEAIRRKPRDGNLYDMRGHAYFAQGRISLACSDAKKACALGNCQLLKIAKKDGDCL